MLKKNNFLFVNSSDFTLIRFIAFVLATIIWTIPWTTVFVLAWTSFYNSGKQLTSFKDIIQNIDISMLLYAGVLFVITILFAKFLKSKNK